MDIGSLRREYESQGLSRSDLAGTPMAQFEHWFEEARVAEVADINALSLATVDTSGMPAVRTVLLKSFDDSGFIFFTNYDSHKGLALASNPKASLLLPWLALNRQVIVQGTVEKVSEAVSREYFRSRPRASQLSAWASSQSAQVDSREALEAQLAEVKQRFGDGEIPLPPFWGGYRVLPQRVEFWQGRPSRLHDRFEYVRKEAEWQIRRLQP